MAAAFAATGAVRAQSSATTDTSSSLPAITVTSSPDGVRRAGALVSGAPSDPLDTPASVSSVPADLLRAQSVTTLQDALRNVPGVQSDSGFNGSHTQFFSMRGAIADSGTGSNRILRDGVRLSNYPYVPAFIDSVDVLRGPGAAVGVRSEAGGTVNLGTRQPQRVNFGSVLVGKGTHGALETTLDLNRVVSQEDEVAARLIVTQSNASEWRHAPDRLSGLKLGIAKSDGERFHLRAGIEATNQTYQPDYGLPAANGRPVAVPLDRQLSEPFADSTTNNRIFELHGDVALSSATRLAIDYTHLQAQATVVRNVIFGNPVAGTYGRATSVEPDTDRRIDSLVASVTSRQTFAGLEHQLYVDVAYYREDLDLPSASVPAASSTSINVYNPVYGTQPYPASFTPGATTRQRLQSTALSLQDQLDLGAWSLVGGLRLVQQDFLYGTPGVQPVDERRWSPKVALLRRLSEQDTVYASVSSGIAPNQVASASNQSLASRRSAQAELGWKSLWAGGAVSTDVAIYQLDQTNMISSDLSTPAAFDFNLAGAARSRGLEASVTGKLSDRVSVSAAYAYTAARYQENALYGGRHVPNVARHTVNLWGQYQWDDQWSTGAGVYAQSARFADEYNSAVLPGYARVDLVQTWKKPLANGQSFELQLALRNAFDKAYYVSSHVHVSRWIMPAQGRNAYVTGTYRF